MIRALIVDDSAAMRAIIRSTLSRAPDIEVVGEAADAAQARAAIRTLDPDVVTLDVEMPGMNGLEFLRKIMSLRPTPVIMVSSLTRQGGEIALAALEIGAVDCVAKPLGAVGDFDGLADKVRAAAGARLQAANLRDTSPEPAAKGYVPSRRLVAIGSSTGGVEALMTLLSGFPANGPPTVITQHMPATFTRSFAARLDSLCAPRVLEAFDGAPLTPGVVYLAPGGGRHLQVEKGPKPVCRLIEAPPVNGHRPSVDVLFESVAKAVGACGVGVILTGMGKDGAQGLLTLRQAGGATFGQDEASSVVYGMPKIAWDIGAVQRQAPPRRLAFHILTATRAVPQEA